MKVLTSCFRAWVVGVSLAGTLAACDNGGNDSIRLFFGYGDSSSDGDCGLVEIVIDAERADAVFARNSGGELDCVESALAREKGCDVDFEEIDEGDLHVSVHGCSLSSFEAYFECGFTEADLSELADNVAIVCDCEDDGCDFRPPACLGRGDSFTGCEVCDNAEDDDHDGKADCEDANCLSSNKCVPSASSTSTTATSSTIGTDQPHNYDVTFRLLGNETVGSLQWTTDYSSVQFGTMIGSGEDVECASLIDGALAAFNDDDQMFKLESGVVFVAGFQAPVDVARCTFRSDFFPGNGDFDVVAVEAATPELVLIQPAPVIQVNVQRSDAAILEKPAR